MSSEALELGIGVVKRIAAMWRGAKADSLIDYTRVARVEPIVLIDADCLYLDSLSEVQQSLLSIFAGYYLQAVSLSTTVGKIDVMRHLDALNPTRSASDNAINGLATGWLMAQESYRYALPLPQRAVALESISNDVIEDRKEVYRTRVAMEAAGQGQDGTRQSAAEIEQERHDMAINKDIRDEEKHGRETSRDYFDRSMVYSKKELDDKKFNLDEKKLALDEEQMQQRLAEVNRNYEFNKEKFGHEKAMSEAKHELEKAGLALNQRKLQDSYSASEIGFGRDTMAALKDLSNLSVGKLFTVEITDGLHKASIPVSIRLMASSLPSTSLVHILSSGHQDNSMKERYHAWRAGRLEFIKDLVMCQDLIDAHRKTLMADKDGIYSTILRRNRGNQLSTIVSTNPSVATASNLVIISSDTAAALEMKLEGKLKDFNVREKMFKQTYIMIMAVIDKQWERVTFYHRGIHLPTEVGMRDLKASNKGNGVDVSEVLRAYQMGNAPSL